MVSAEAEGMALSSMELRSVSEREVLRLDRHPRLVFHALIPIHAAQSASPTAVQIPRARSVGSSISTRAPAFRK